MNVQQFLQQTTRVSKGYYGFYEKVRPHITCKDGFNVSVQAGLFGGWYDSIEVSHGLGSGYVHFNEVELGFPNMEDDLIKEYAEEATKEGPDGEDVQDYLHTVYPYVPIEVVEKLIEKHGGIDEEKTTTEPPTVKDSITYITRYEDVIY